MATVVVAGLGAAAFLVLPGSNDDPDPDELQDDAEAAIDEANSFSFTFTGESEIASDDFLSRSFSGEGVWNDGASRQIVDDDYSASETIFEGSTYLQRLAEDVEGLTEEQWGDFSAGPGDEILSLEEQYTTMQDTEAACDTNFARRSTCGDALAIAANQMVFIGGGFGPAPELLLPGAVADDLVGDPGAFTAAVGQMDNPTVVESDGGVTTLAGTLAVPASDAEAFGRAIPKGHLEIDLGDDDLPTALRYKVEAGDSSYSIDVAFADWGQADEIVMPADDEIDPTPYLDEEGLRAATDITPVLPTAPPEGWTLGVSSPDELAGFTFFDCPAIQLWWGEPLAEDAGPAAYAQAEYLTLTLYAQDCAVGEDDRPFGRTGPGGLPQRTIEGLDQLLVGTTVVEVDTSMSRSQLDAVLATLAPTDIDTLIAAATTAGG